MMKPLHVFSPVVSWQHRLSFSILSEKVWKIKDDVVKTSNDDIVLTKVKTPKHSRRLKSIILSYDNFLGFKRSLFFTTCLLQGPDPRSLSL